MASDNEKSVSPRGAFLELASIASKLNSSTDELKRAVLELDKALESLNMGISAWVPFPKRGYGITVVNTHEVGYDKIKGQWGIAIRPIKAVHSPILGMPQKDEIWLFGDAPRGLRLAAIPALSKMIAQLRDSASTALEKVQTGLGEVRMLTADLGLIKEEAKEKRGTK
jgi:hypothetical protein